MNLEFGQWLATLGVGGVLAGLMFMFYRKDVRAYTDLWKAQSEQMTTIVKENTQALTSNTEVIRALHRRLDRRHDHDEQE